MPRTGIRLTVILLSKRFKRTSSGCAGGHGPLVARWPRSAYVMTSRWNRKTPPGPTSCSSMTIWSNIGSGNLTILLPDSKRRWHVWGLEIVCQVIKTEHLGQSITLLPFYYCRYRICARVSAQCILAAFMTSTHVLCLSQSLLMPVSLYQSVFISSTLRVRSRVYHQRNRVIDI